MSTFVRSTAYLTYDIKYVVYINIYRQLIIKNKSKANIIFKNLPSHKYIDMFPVPLK